MLKQKLGKATGLAMLLFLLPMTAQASFVKLNMRCSEDSLEVTEAVERVEWATKCSYIDADDRNDALFTGATNKRRERPQYPTFTTADYGSMWKAPVDRNAPCTVPPGYQVRGFCTSSCYTPDQALLFPEGFVAIKKARDLYLPQVMTLSDKSTIESLQLKAVDVAAYTEEIRDTWHDILVFRTKSGGELKVTKNHPVIDGDGKVRSAESFKVGENLIHYENGLDPIVSLEPVRFFGKVYNITPASELLTSHIVVAQGYLNGSAHYQNEGVNLLNRNILRKTIPAGLVQ